MAHARAWVATNYPGALTIEASKRVVHRPPPHHPFTVAEDIWGVFDIMVFPYDLPIIPIQVTTQTEGRTTVAPRQRKIEKWIRDAEWQYRPPWMGEIYVMSWIRRKHFRRWVLADWQPPRWVETAPCLAPLPRKERSTSEPTPG